MDNNKNWIDQRFPLTKVWNEHLAEYYTPTKVGGTELRAVSW
jgi:quinol-cytochrome oxidoreductase complex cytochrome b subunit